MDKKDLAQIKLGSPAFTSKWWKENRPEATKGSGVAKALDDWQKACPKDPAKLSGPAATEVAAKAAEALIAAMTKARIRCLDDKGSADACQRYIKIATDYRDKIAPAPPAEGADAAAEDKAWAKVQARMTKALTAAKATAAKGAKMIEAVAVVNQALAKITLLANARVQGKTGHPIAELHAKLDKIGAALKPPSRFLAQHGALHKLHKEVLAAAGRMTSPTAMAATKAYDLDFDKLMEFETRLELAIKDAGRELDEARAIVSHSDRTLDSVRTAYADFHDAVYDHVQVSLHQMPGELNALVAEAIEIIKMKDRPLNPGERSDLRARAEALAERLAQLDRIAAAHGSDGASMKKLVRGFESEPDFALALPKLDKELTAMRTALKTAEKAVGGARKVAEALTTA